MLLIIVFIKFISVQFGTPTFSVAMFLGMTAASFATIIESIGSFAAVSKICEVKPAPSYVVNRALTVSGFASAFASVIGSAHACVSFSSTVAFVGITKVQLILFLQSCVLYEGY